MYSSFFSCISHGYIFTTYFIVVTGSMKLGTITLFNFAFEMNSASSLCLIIWFCELELCLAYALSLFMVRGHKDSSLWPKASPLSNLFGSFVSLFCRYQLVFIWNPFD